MCVPQLWRMERPMFQRTRVKVCVKDIRLVSRKVISNLTFSLLSNHVKHLVQSGHLSPVTPTKTLRLKSHGEISHTNSARGCVGFMWTGAQRVHAISREVVAKSHEEMTRGTRDPLSWITRYVCTCYVQQHNGDFFLVPFLFVCRFFCACALVVTTS